MPSSPVVVWGNITGSVYDFDTGYYVSVTVPDDMYATWEYDPPDPSSDNPPGHYLYVIASIDDYAHNPFGGRALIQYRNVGSETWHYVASIDNNINWFVGDGGYVLTLPVQDITSQELEFRIAGGGGIYNWDFSGLSLSLAIPAGLIPPGLTICDEFVITQTIEPLTNFTVSLVPDTFPCFSSFDVIAREPTWTYWRIRAAFTATGPTPGQFLTLHQEYVSDCSAGVPFTTYSNHIVLTESDFGIPSATDTGVIAIDDAAGNLSFDISRTGTGWPDMEITSTVTLYCPGGDSALGSVIGLLHLSSGRIAVPRLAQTSVMVID